MSLSKVERIAILKRDDFRCQGCDIFLHCPDDRDRRFRGEALQRAQRGEQPRIGPNDNGEDFTWEPKLNVHHIIPEGYAIKVGIPDPDTPTNLISICEEFHTGPHGIHPEIFQARIQLPKDPDAIKKAVRGHQDSLDRREIYWNTQWDRQLAVKALKNTQTGLIEGWDWPTADGELLIDAQMRRLLVLEEKNRRILGERLFKNE